ncbi:MAG: glycoside hydrolase family 32 protein [Victivallales bacterium]|nr:glycoside hydrolase family 32 protein [Victivallales bacterium]
MTSESYRPLYHFTAPEQVHFPFDPNGFIFHRGRYHAFYLFQDETGCDLKTCWGHASTTDFIHWDYHPVALLCDHPGEQAMYSGCALRDKDGVPVLFYFSVGEGICLATPLDDELLQWQKSPANPVIRQPQKGSLEYDVYNVFDPHAWLDTDGQYYMILAGGGGTQNQPYLKYDTAYLFRSPDLIHWEYLQPFYQTNGHFTRPFDDCACPDFFQIGDRYALLCISHTGGARYYLGDYAQHTFIPRSHHWLNGTGGVFAPESWLDDRGRRIVCFWYVNKTVEPYNVDFMECWTMPREVRLAPDGSCLLQFVPEEFRQLYGTPQEIHVAVSPDGTRQVLPIHGRCGKLRLTLILSGGQFSLQVLSDASGEECLELVIDRETRKVLLDASKSWHPFRRTPHVVNIYQAPEYEVTPGNDMHYAPEDGRYELEIYLDYSIVEVFSTDGRLACAQAVWNHPESDCMAIRMSSAACARLEKLEYIPMGVPPRS